MIVGLVSDCEHVYLPNGSVASTNHIYVKQMEALANVFGEMIICCPFASFNDNVSVTAYSNTQIRFIPLPVVGGTSILDKAKLLATIPTWLIKFRQLAKQSDIIYQRFPNNLNIPGFFYFKILNKKVFATYTGTWKNDIAIPFTYRLQKWLLRNWFKGPVFVYSDEHFIANNIYSSFSPSYSKVIWDEENEAVQVRIEQLIQQTHTELSLMSIGRLDENKNHRYLLQTAVQLSAKKIPFKLTIVGDGILKGEYEEFIQKNQLHHQVTLTGALNTNDIRVLLRQHNFIVQATLNEGFGKVPIEGFFHGLVPLLHKSAMAPYLTGNGERGFLFDATLPNNLFELLISMYSTPPAKLFVDKIIAGRKFAQAQTLENWANTYYKIVTRYID